MEDFIKISRSELEPLTEVCKYIDEGQAVPLNFSKDGFELKTLNTTSTCLCEAHITPKDFLSYNVAKPFSICCDLNLLHRILKKMSSYELSFSVKDNRFVISSSEERFAIPLISTEENKCPDLDNLKFDVEFETDKAELYKILSSANIISNEIDLVVNGVAKFSTNTHQGEFEKTLKIRTTDKKTKKDIKAKFSIEYLKRLCERGSYGNLKIALSPKAILLSEPNLKIIVASIVDEDYSNDEVEEEEEEE